MMFRYVFLLAILMSGVASCASTAHKPLSTPIQSAVSNGDYTNLSSSDEAVRDEVTQLLISQGLDPVAVNNHLAAAGVSIVTLRNQVKLEVERQGSAK